MMKRPPPHLLAAILAAMLLLPACRRAEDADTTPTVTVDVRTAVVRAGSVEETVGATGTTITLREYQLRSPITGVIVSFGLYNGDRVKRGEVIALVRTRESEASIQGAEEILRSSTSEKQREEAERALELARRSATTVAIRAPFDGILSNRVKNEMEVVGEGDQIATLVDPSSVVFSADVPSGSLRSIRVGQSAGVKLSSFPGAPLRGRVKRIEPQVNPGDQTAKVQIELIDKPASLERSLFGEAAITVGEHRDVLLVPTAALLHDDENNRWEVMVVSPDSVARTVPVVVGVRKDSVAEVSSPALTARSLVIVEGQYGLPDSTKVRMIR